MLLKTGATLKQLCLTEREIPSQQLSRNSTKVLMRNIASHYDLASVQLNPLAIAMSCQVQQLRINCMGSSPGQNLPCKLTRNKRQFVLESFQVFAYCLTKGSSIGILLFWGKGNISRLPISTCCRQRCNFDRNSLILSILVSRFSFRPCIHVFNSFRR